MTVLRFLIPFGAPQAIRQTPVMALTSCLSIPLSMMTTRLKMSLLALWCSDEDWESLFKSLRREFKQPRKRWLCSIFTPMEKLGFSDLNGTEIYLPFNYPARLNQKVPSYWFSINLSVLMCSLKLITFAINLKEQIWNRVFLWVAFLKLYIMAKDNTIIMLNQLLKLKKELYLKRLALELMPKKMMSLFNIIQLCSAQVKMPNRKIRNILKQRIKTSTLTTRLREWSQRRVLILLRSVIWDLTTIFPAKALQGVCYLQNRNKRKALSQISIIQRIKAFKFQISN